MMFVWILCLLRVQIALARARHNSHWMVTETGLIQPRDESPFLMSKPFDLLSFLNQDTRWENILNIHSDLIRRQQNINELWLKLEESTKFSEYIAENKDCMQVGNIDSLDWYTSFLLDGQHKSITEKEFALQRSEYGATDVPDCKKISSLTFSMFAFEHLDGMINRENLSATPEFTMPAQFKPLMTVDQFGHWISGVLRKNSSSWLHYNLAALYWRIKGQMPKAIECSRRAVHYAPRCYKDIPLHCMGTILHRSQHSEDALIVWGAALDHEAGYSILHFSKGIALATVGDFNSSLMHFSMSMKLNSRLEVAQRFKHGALCHIYLLKKMGIARRSLKETYKVLKEYSDLENDWYRFQIAFLQTMKLEEKYDYSNFDVITAKMGEITGVHFGSLKNKGDRNTLALYFLESPTYNELWEKQKGPNALDTANALQQIVQYLGAQTGIPSKNYLSADTKLRNSTEILKEIGPRPVFPKLSPDLQHIKPLMKTNQKKSREIFIGEESMVKLNPGAGYLLYPPNFKVNRNREVFDTDPDWPSDKFCQENYPTFPESLELSYPVFMPFANKGIILENLLTEKIGVPALLQHDLPWHPPVCPTDKALSLYTRKKGQKIQMIPDAIGKEYLWQQIMKFMSEGHYDILMNIQYEEIGQRIQTAIKKNLAEKWVLYTLASLYWRARGNIPSALNCLLTASRTADPRYRDVVLVSLASVFMEMGLLDESADHAEDAYKINSYEPTTNFMLAQLSLIKKTNKALMFHLKQTIRVDEHFMNGYARNLLYDWACILREIETLQKGKRGLDVIEICADVQPGLSMVCERDGTKCRYSKRECINPLLREMSQVVRMLEVKDDTIQGRPHVREEINQSVFDKVVEGYPQSRWDYEGHRKNYDEMMKVVNKVMEGCKENRACWQREPGDLKVNEADCAYQKSQLDYWLYHISFNVKLPADIASTAPSKTPVPDCKVPIGYESDFFLERIMKVDTKSWVTLGRLMRQFTDTYSSYDSKVIGAKIARYVEMNPQSWTGLIAAGWWCGASGNGLCAVRCFAAAHAEAPTKHHVLALRLLSAMLHMQSKKADAKKIAYLAFYEEPKNKVGAFFVALTHTYRGDYDYAAWMYRYAMTFDDSYPPARASLHIAICYMVYGDTSKKEQ